MNDDDHLAFLTIHGLSKKFYCFNLDLLRLVWLHSIGQILD